LAWDFKGTFNRSQLERFKAFARAQLSDVSGRLNHLEFEKQRQGSVSFAYDSNGVPTSYSPDPSDSYLGKLLAAYEILGGDPFYDLKVRSRKQPVFVIRADETSPPRLMSSGEVVGTLGLADSASAYYMDQARGWVDDAIYYRRESLERKIRRTLDYVEQLEIEQEALTTISSGPDVEGSLEQLFTAIQQLMDDPSYRAAYDDKGADPQGQLTTAPLAAYSPGPNREATDYGRGPDGAFKPGSTG
jgi:hypothetical protein